MSVFNGSKYLDQSIKSILKQSYTNFEFIIIDDGSTDKTYDIISRNMKIDKRIIGFRQDHHGLATTLNFGISKAKGKYIARMDADDISHSRRFEKQIQILENQDIDVVGTNITYIDKDGNLLGKIVHFPENDVEIKWNLFFTNPIAHPTVMMKKSIFTNNVSYNANYQYSQDYELWNRITNNCKFHNIQQILLKFRLKNDNEKINRQMDYIIKTQQSLLKQFDSSISFDNAFSFNSLIKNKLKSKYEFQKSFYFLNSMTRFFINMNQIKNINKCYAINQLITDTYTKVLINNGRLSFIISIQIITMLIYYNSKVLLTKGFWWSIKIWFSTVTNIFLIKINKYMKKFNWNVLSPPKEKIL